MRFVESFVMGVVVGRPARPLPEPQQYGAKRPSGRPVEGCDRRPGTPAQQRRTLMGARREARLRERSRATCHTLRTHNEMGDCTVHGLWRRLRRGRARGRVRASCPIKVSRREARSSANRAVTVRAPATVHISLTSAAHALSHIELMGVITEATGEAPSRTASPAAPPARPPGYALTATPGATVADASTLSTMPVMGIVDAATARTVHVRLNARATAAHKPRRDKRATLRATGVDTQER